MCKKFLSIILTAVMVLSLLPAAGAVTYPDGEAPQAYKYVFNSYAHTASPGTSGISLSYGTNSIEKTVTDASPGKWGLAGIRGNETGVWTYKRNFSTYQDRIQWSFDLSEAGYENASAALAAAKYPTFNPDSTGEFPAFMLALDVTTGGTFYPVLEFVPDASSSVVEVFLVKGEEGKQYSDEKCTEYIRSIDPATRLGSVDLSTAAQGQATEIQFPAVTLDGNSVYFLVIVANGYGKGTPAWHTNGLIYSNHKFTGFRLDAVATGAAATYNFTWDAWGLSANTLLNKVANLVSGKSDEYSGVKYNELNSYQINNDYIRVNYKTSSTDPYLVIKLSVPHSGRYSVGINGYNVCATAGGGTTKIYGADAKIYVLPAVGTFEKSLCTNENYIGEYHFYDPEKAKNTEVRDVETLPNKFDVEAAGEYWLVLDLCDDSGAMNAANSAFNITDGTEWATHYEARFGSITLTNLGLTDAELAKAPQSVDPKNAASNDVTLGNESAEIKVLTSTVAENEGTIVGELCKNAAVGSAQSITAPAIDENREFLYWTSGIGTDRKIVCETEKYDFTAQKGVTYLTAVYRDMTSDYVSVIFLNGNGELISRSDATYKEGNTVTIEALPTLTGFGTASGWQLAGTEDVYTTESTVTAIGKTMVFVAQYENEETSIDITVNGGTMVVEDEKTTPVYGDQVTVTAPSREGGSGYNVFA